MYFITLDHYQEYYLHYVSLHLRNFVRFRETTKSTKAQVGKKTARRSKEKVQFVTDPQARSSALYKRKSTLFSKGLKLHAMTNAEVLIIIDHKGQRFVGGSHAILDMYNNGLTRPTGTDQEYVEDAVSTSTETNSTGVQPLENTPENLMLDHRFANILGHSSSSQAPPSRRSLAYSHSSSGEIPRPVQDLLSNRPKPQLSDSERNDVPPIQRQSKICFIPDKDVDFVVSNLSEKEANT